ncbi:MAG: peptidylprolyl isomerase [Pseudomonadota bacterium]
MRSFVFSALGAGMIAAPAFAQETAVDVVNAAPASAWRTADPDDLLVLTLTTGEVIVEMREDFAPGHVQRIKELTRDRFYDGLLFHRVIDGFMAQGGDPGGDGTGGSDKPDLQAEFTYKTRSTEDFRLLGRDTVAARVGYVRGAPVGTLPEQSRAVPADGALPSWPLHCRGAVSMARSGDPNSANSQFFIVFDDARTSLDRRYTVWGQVVSGHRAVDALPRGEPPERPGKILRARIATDLPSPPAVEVMRTDSQAFSAYLAKFPVYSREPEEDRVGFVRDICRIPVPARINGEVTF